MKQNLNPLGFDESAECEQDWIPLDSQLSPARPDIAGVEPVSVDAVGHGCNRVGRNTLTKEKIPSVSAHSKEMVGHL